MKNNKATMRTHWTLSENGWEYFGEIYITSKEMPTTTEPNGHEIIVDGVVIEFDEEIRFAGVVDDA